MYILKQTNLLKFGLITIGLIVSLFCFYVIVGFLGIEYLMQPYKYGTFFAWAIILFSIFYRFTFLLLTIGVFFGIIIVFEWHMIFAIIFTLPSLLFIFPKQILNFKIKTKKQNSQTNKNYTEERTQPFNKTLNRFNNKSTNNEIIDADYEIIKDEENKN
jgi:ABC-type multidrug transport system fused ATPase/permease subunit